MPCLRASSETGTPLLRSLISILRNSERSRPDRRIRFLVGRILVAFVELDDLVSVFCNSSSHIVIIFWRRRICRFVSCIGTLHLGWRDARADALRGSETTAGGSKSKHNPLKKTRSRRDLGHLRPLI